VIAGLINAARRDRSAVYRRCNVITIKLVPTALIAVLCSAAPLLAQSPAPAPAQTPAVASPQAPAAMPAVQPPPPAATPSPMEPDRANVIALLDRIQKVLDTAVDEQRAKGPTISIDRGLVDELRANVTQIRLSLQAERTLQSANK
jgi:hypothetical protein